MKLCKDCRHFQNGNCLNPKNVWVSPVLGLITCPANSAEYLREEHMSEKHKACEPEALWFEEKIVQEQAA